MSSDMKNEKAQERLKRFTFVLLWWFDESPDAAALSALHHAGPDVKVKTHLPMISS